MTETENKPEVTEEDPSFLEDVSTYCWTESPDALEAMLIELAEQDEEDRWVEHMAALFETDLPGWFK